MIEHSPEYKAVAERYSLAWRDWYYWPMSDEGGEAKAKRRLEAIGKELNEAGRAEREALR